MTTENTKAALSVAILCPVNQVSPKELDHDAIMATTLLHTPYGGIQIRCVGAISIPDRNLEISDPDHEKEVLSIIDRYRPAAIILLGFCETAMDALKKFISETTDCSVYFARA